MRRNPAGRRFGIWLIAGIAATAMAADLAVRAGIVHVGLQRPDTHWFWYFSRASGITAYLALAIATCWGLFISTGLADAFVARGRSVEAHQWLSLVGLVLGASHGLVLVADRYVGFDLLDVMIPFVAPYRPAGVALGILGLYLAVAVYGSFWLRGRIGMRAWRAVHVLSFPAFAGITLHGMVAGSDGGSIWLRLLYLTAAATVLWLVFARVTLVMRKSSGEAAGAEARGAVSGARAG